MNTAFWLRTASIVSLLFAAFVLASLAGGILTWRFILSVPALFSAVLTACLALAFRGAVAREGAS